MKTRNVIFGTIAFSFVTLAASAQTRQPSIPAEVLNQAINSIGGQTQAVNGAIANGAQWANVAAAESIYSQMRAGSQIVINSELFLAIIDVSFLIAIVAICYRGVDWLAQCQRHGTALPLVGMEILPIVFLLLLLVNPTGQGYGIQSVTMGTMDLANSATTYILRKGGTATQQGGSAVLQASTKAQVEQSIRSAQIDCAAILNEQERRSCYQDGYNSVSAQLDRFRSADWAKSLSTYAASALLENGKNASQGGAIAGAAGGILSGVASNTANAAVNFAGGVLSAPIYALMLLFSSALGMAVGYIMLLTIMLSAISVGMSFFPVFEGSWILWFKGVFGVWVSGLLLRMIVTISAIITVSGSAISGSLYVVSSLIISLVLAGMAAVSLVSTVTGIISNTASNVARLK